MAIARDANSTGTVASNTTLTVAHTLSGINNMLFVSVTAITGTDVITGVTYNGDALALVDKVAAQANVWVYLFWKYYSTTDAAPHNIVATSSSATNIRLCASSYTGTRGAIDSTNKGNGSVSLTVSTTTVLDNCWVVGGAVSADNTLTDGTGYNGVTNSNNRLGIGDSNGVKTPAGAYEMTVTSGDVLGLVMASFGQTPTTTITDTNVTTEQLGIFGFGTISQSDTNVSTDTDKVGYGWSNDSKPTTTWTNVSKP